MHRWLLVAVLAGCTTVTPTGPAAASFVDAPEDAPEAASASMPTPLQEAFDLVVPLTAATPAYGADGTDGSFNGVDIAHITPGPNVTGYVVEVIWHATASVHDELAIWVRGHTNPPSPDPVPDWLLLPAPHAVVQGPSPLRVVLPAADLSDPEGYTVFVRAAASPVGVSYDQPVVASMASFVGLPMDPDWRFSTQAGPG